MTPDRIVRGRTPTRSATVLAVVGLTPRMRRITLAGPELVGVEVRPAQDAELIIAEATGRKVKRRYTVARARVAAGEWDVDALLHGDGPGARWAATVQPGSPVEVIGPRGRLELRPAAWHLLVGDEAALPAIVAITAAVPADEPVLARIEVGSAQDELPVTRPAGELDVRYLHRGPDVAAGGVDLLGAALDDTVVPGPGGRGYLLGESRAVIGLRAHAARLGLGVEDLYVKGYWNRGRHPSPHGTRPATTAAGTPAADAG